MTTWHTFGHENIKKILDLQMRSGKLSHGYLFCGPEGIGKKELALEFAQKILIQTKNSSGSSLQSHPDFSILDQIEEISMERMHQFMEGLSFKPFVSSKKIAIINNAHLLNTQSSNALLKTLEEPSPSTILILISANKDVLPTILSRSQFFSFNLFTESQLTIFAQEKNILATTESVMLSFGRIDRLLSLQDKKKLEYEKNIISQFEELQISPEAERLLAVNRFAELEPEDLRNLFLSWTFWKLQQLRSNTSSYKMVGSLLEALAQLQTNKNKKLILQSLFLRI